MPHYNSYDSTKTKRCMAKKERAKARSGAGVSKENLDSTEFVLKNTNELTGIVIETRYNEATIFYSGKLVEARMKSGMNVVCNQAVFPGDVVTLTEEQPSEFYIEHMLKRKNVLARVKKDGTRNSTSSGVNHIIAANIDLAVIVVSAGTPPLHPKFIDRYLMILQNNGIECAICMNKSDLKTEKEEIILDIYRKLKIPVIETSALGNSGIEEIKDILKDKQAIFIGHSGVGKSSLTNALMGTEDIHTSHVSEKSGKGRHTTTTSKYYIWQEGSSIIDTPGIRSLDISHFKPEEIQDYFSEFADWSKNCKYSDCLHYREPVDACMIKQAVQSGIITKSRYESYVRIVKDVTNDKDDNRSNETEI